MECIWPLDGEDWQLTGWHRNEWRTATSMELGMDLLPSVPSLPAKVPGAVQSDLLHAGWVEPYNFGLNSLHMEWVNQREWVMEKSFSLADGWIQDRCELRFEGLDYWGQIWLNGCLLGEFEGMFTPHQFDVTSILREESEGANKLQVVFYQPPEVDGQVGYSHTIDKLKSRFNYHWDWCPRIVPVGIWKNVYLHTHSQCKIVNYYPDAQLAENRRQGAIRSQSALHVLTRGEYAFEYEVFDSDGQRVLHKRILEEIRGGERKVEHLLYLDDVKLWWPNGYGEASLYRVLLKIVTSEGRLCDTSEKHIGFRTVEFASNPGAPETALNYTLIVNGRRIVMKGVNWVPVTPLYGSVTKEEYDVILSRFKAMNTNMLRVWGGAIIERELFYDYCNHNGILVWQEFLQSSSGISNSPSEQPELLDKLEQAARHAVLEKRSHPSLVIWCGGNELMTENYKPVNENHRNIAMLRRVVDELDSKRHFLPTSASGPKFVATEDDFGLGVHHDVHGPWKYEGPERHYAFFNGDDALLRSETGAPGTSRATEIRRLAASYSPWPPVKSNPLWVHRGAWWIQWEELNALAGPWDETKDELDAYCQISRFLQWEAIRYAAESSLRREPGCSGFMVWMGNEPFANFANTSLLEYDGTPKPAYYAIKKAYAQLHLSAAYSKLAFAPGERFIAELYVHDARGSREASNWTLKASLFNLSGEILVEHTLEVPSWSEAGVHFVHSLGWEVARVPFECFVLELALYSETDGVLAENQYLFSTDCSYPLKPLRELPSAELELHMDQEGKRIRVTNVSEVAAVGVLLSETNPAAPVHFHNNYCCIMPNRSIGISSVHLVETLDDIVVEGMNLRA